MHPLPRSARRRRRDGRRRRRSPLRREQTRRSHRTIRRRRARDAPQRDRRERRRDRRARPTRRHVRAHPRRCRRPLRARVQEHRARRALPRHRQDPRGALRHHPRRRTPSPPRSGAPSPRTRTSAPDVLEPLRGFYPDLAGRRARAPRALGRNGLSARAQGTPHPALRSRRRDRRHLRRDHAPPPLSRRTAGRRRAPGRSSTGAAPSSTPSSSTSSSFRRSSRASRTRSDAMERLEAAGAEATHERARTTNVPDITFRWRPGRSGSRERPVVGSDAPNSALITATPAAPARQHVGTRSLVMPPIATAGSPHRARQLAEPRGADRRPRIRLAPRREHRSDADVVRARRARDLVVAPDRRADDESRRHDAAQQRRREIVHADVHARPLPPRAPRPRDRSR